MKEQRDDMHPCEEKFEGNIERNIDGRKGGRSSHGERANGEEQEVKSAFAETAKEPK